MRNKFSNVKKPNFGKRTQKRRHQMTKIPDFDVQEQRKSIDLIHPGFCCYCHDGDFFFVFF